MVEHLDASGNFILSRLHVELGHSDPRGMIHSSAKKTRTQTHHSLQPKGSAAARVKKVRDEDYVWWLLAVLHEPGTCLKVDQCEWKHLVLNLHVLGAIMVDAGRRAASVRIHRVMDTEHGLGNVTGVIMLNTLLHHWIKYYGKANIVSTDPEGAFRDQGFRRGLAAKSIRLDNAPGDASWKTGVLGKTLGTIDRHQYVWLEELLTVSQFQKSLMDALRLTMTYIEIEDSLRGSCLWGRHRQTRQFAKILIWLSAASKLWTKLQHSVSV